MVKRQGAALVLVGRFLPGIRIAINLSCGAGQMDYRRFLLFDTIGAILWSSQAALLGYFAGKAFADQLWVAFVVAFAVTGIVGAFVDGQGAPRVRRENAEAAAERAGREGVAAARPRGLTNSPDSWSRCEFFVADCTHVGSFHQVLRSKLTIVAGCSLRDTRPQSAHARDGRSPVHPPPPDSRDTASRPPSGGD